MIGIIGVGGVARYAHLPAYRDRGLPVAALCDVDAAMSARLAEDFGISRVFDDPEALIAHPGVEAIDVATPPGTHRRLLELAAGYGKPVLVQKPLCISREDFEAISLLERSGLQLRLNMTGRHVSAWRKVEQLIRDGTLGSPVLCTIINRDWWDREPGRWEHDIDGFILFEMTIHHLDLCLYWFGMPRAVTARGGIHPRQRIAQKNWATVMLEYDGGFTVQIVDDWTMSEFAFASGHPLEQVMITGSNGVIRATSECVEFAERGSNATRSWHLPRPGQSLPGEVLEVEWFPGSFGCAMESWLAVLGDAAVAAADWRHLRDLTALTFAVHDAMASTRWQPIEAEKMNASSVPPDQREAGNLASDPPHSRPRAENS